MKTLFIVFLSLIFALEVNSQNTSGTLQFDFTTISNGKSYSPKHVLAVWIETEQGDFIKTLSLNANKRKKYLYSWNSSSSGNTTDAITGETLLSHSSHSFDWNISNTDGDIVPDGNYKIIAEYTSEHDQGPILQLSFSKNDMQFNIQPENENYFESISLSFTPESKVGTANHIHVENLNIYPNPAKDFINVQMSIQKAISLQLSLHDTKMSLIKILYSGNNQKGKVNLSFDTKNINLDPGIYFILIKANHQQIVKQIIIN